jgi:signal transduction histidine kinase
MRAPAPRGYGGPMRARLEVLLALAMTAGIEAELALNGDLDSVGQALAAALLTLPLAVRFRWPLFTITAGAVGSVVMTTLNEGADDPILGIVAALLALYAVGSRTTGWRFWLGGAIALVGGAASLLIREGVTSDLATITLITGVGLLIGRALGVLETETEVLEREGDERAEQAVADERSRIARELHDVIGHSISVMGVQAGAVRRVLRPEQEREREALLAVEQTGREAVAEMRRLIGLLRTDESGIAGPSPSLSRVEQLVSDMRQAGLPVELRVEGNLDGLPPGADLAGYRVVQEALTNALKHAGGAHVCATVRADGRDLSIEILDDGDGSAATANGHIGHGLLGMRERVSLYGGELRAGPRPEGGFRVEARIPIEAA